MTVVKELPLGMTPSSSVSGAQSTKTAITPTTHWAMTAVPLARSTGTLRKISPTMTMSAIETRTGGSQAKSENTAESAIAARTIATKTVTASGHPEP